MWVTENKQKAQKQVPYKSNSGNKQKSVAWKEMARAVIKTSWNQKWFFCLLWGHLHKCTPKHWQNSLLADFDDNTIVLLIFRIRLIFVFYQKIYNLVVFVLFSCFFYTSIKFLLLFISVLVLFILVHQVMKLKWEMVKW